MYASYTTCTHSLGVVSYNILVHLHFNCDLSQEIRCRIFHLWHYVRGQNISDFGALQITGFWIRHAQYVIEQHEQ